MLKWFLQRNFFHIRHFCYIKSMVKETFEFVMYMIHACANRWNEFPSVVYKKLQESGCIQGFLVPCYDVLHTMGTDSVVDDVEIFLKNHGVSV